MKMYNPLESSESAASQHHSVQATEKEVDGSRVLAMGVSHGPPAAGRARPPLLFVVPGSDSHAITDHCSSRLLTVLPVQEMLKSLFVVLSIFHKQLSVLKQMNLSSIFSLVFTGSQKSPQHSIFHLKHLFLCSCFPYILDFSPRSQLFSLILSL